MSWDQEAAEAMHWHAVVEGTDALPWGCQCGEAFRTSLKHAEHVVAANLDALAPVVAREVARAELRGKVAALRGAAEAWSDWDALQAPEEWLNERADAIEAQTGGGVTYRFTHARFHEWDKNRAGTEAGGS